MFFGTFWEHHTCLYIYHVLIIKYLNIILCYSEENASSICANLGSGWRLPTGKEMNYVFLNAGTNGLPNNFFSDSYWGKNEDGTFIVATMSDPDGSATTDELRNGRHTVRCVKLRYPPVG